MLTRCIKFIIQYSLISYILFMGSASVCHADSNFASGDAIGFADVSMSKSDPGIASIMNQWIKAPSSNSLKMFSQQFPVEKSTLVFYANSKTGGIDFVAVVQSKTNLETTDAGKKIASLMRTEVVRPTFDAANYNGLTLYSAPRALKKGDLSYFVRGNYLVWGMGKENIKKVADAMISNKGTIGELSDYKELLTQAPTGSDAIVFLNNTQSRFSNSLGNQEKKWKVSLLLSAKDVSSIFTGINFVDGDKVTGSAIFKAKSEAAIPDIQDDAGFIGEAIRRKFGGSKIGYKKEVITKGNYVILTFEMTGLKPLFKQMFAEGVFSLLK